MKTESILKGVALEMFEAFFVYQSNFFESEKEFIDFCVEATIICMFEELDSSDYSSYILNRIRLLDNKTLWEAFNDFELVQKLYNKYLNKFSIYNLDDVEALLTDKDFIDNIIRKGNK
jgi:hypothetical protein